MGNPAIAALSSDKRLWERPRDEVAAAYAMMSYLVCLPGRQGFGAAMEGLDEDERFDVEVVMERVCGADITCLDTAHLARTFAYFADAVGGAPDLGMLVPG